MTLLEIVSTLFGSAAVLGMLVGNMVEAREERRRNRDLRIRQLERELFPEWFRPQPTDHNGMEIDAFFEERRDADWLAMR